MADHPFFSGTEVYPPTKYRGVYKHPNGLYVAFFGQPKHRTLVGHFSDPEAAARAYDAALSERFRAKAITNVMLGLLPPLSQALFSGTVEVVA